ncbi:SDR family oxidoreductase [Pseudokineococcus marinus]|uniref:SDR family oxidoreductase n=1 Tax=Pseudokineococcus marinus TaxID=351215 RepID=A0A849BNZ8_9ACTN|nr:SDR family oxidoreductase [Pseudokineococcus marinus]NNH22552.1 SDR family oxidoreductase [Pseudokineococcus marinus]
MSTTDRFAGTTVLVTGSAGALGRSLVRQFVAAGSDVAATARTPDALAELLEETGPEHAVALPLDVTDPTSWGAAVGAAEERFGRPVTVLVNNAARLVPGTTESIGVEQFRAVLETNLLGALHGVRAVLPSMRRAGGGSVVNVGSISALAPAPGLIAYSTSKWAVRGMTATMAKELARDGVRVNGVYPGIIDTPLAHDPVTGEELVPVDGFPIPRQASVEEIGRYVLFAAADATFSTGGEIVADGGFLLGAVA